MVDERKVIYVIGVTYNTDSIFGKMKKKYWMWVFFSHSFDFWILIWKWVCFITIKIQNIVTISRILISFYSILFYLHDTIICFVILKKARRPANQKLDALYNALHC